MKGYLQTIVSRSRLPLPVAAAVRRRLGPIRPPGPAPTTADVGVARSAPGQGPGSADVVGALPAVPPVPPSPPPIGPRDTARPRATPPPAPAPPAPRPGPDRPPRDQPIPPRRESRPAGESVGVSDVSPEIVRSPDAGPVGPAAAASRIEDQSLRSPPLPPGPPPGDASSTAAHARPGPAPEPIDVHVVWPDGVEALDRQQRARLGREVARAARDRWRQAAREPGSAPPAARGTRVEVRIDQLNVRVEAPTPPPEAPRSAPTPARPAATFEGFAGFQFKRSLAGS